MSLSADERKAIIALKIAKSDNAYKEMLMCYDMGMYSTAANRLYYALFYACSALLIKDGYLAHTHKGNLSILNMEYIKKGKIPAEYGKLIREVFRLRQDSDYDDFFSTSKEDLESFIKPSLSFIELVKAGVS